MIDMHTHILPAIDDGVKNVSVSTEILRLETEQGVTEIVFTPHYYGNRSLADFLRDRQEAMAKIESVIPDTVRTRLGAEVHFTGVNDPSCEAICSLAIEGTKCVLLEFPFVSKWHDRLLEKVGDFILETGYTPIIAHVERYAEVLKKPAIVSELARMGCLIQINTGAFLRKSTVGFALAALKNGLVHCMGTDTHDTDYRAPDYTAAKKIVYDAGLSQAWEGVQRCIRYVLNGKRADHPFGEIKKRFGRYY